MRDPQAKAARTAWRAFDRAMRKAPAGARFAVGASFNRVHGWRAYYQFGDRDPVFLKPAEALGMVALIDKLEAAPVMRLAPAALAQLFADLKRAALDCEAKNKAGEIMLPGQVAGPAR